MTGVLINIDVDDLERAITFYTQALELTVKRRLSAEVVELAGSDAAIFLLAKPAGSGASPKTALTRSYQRHWTPVHLDFVVNDVEAATTRALQAGAVLESVAQTHSWGRLALLSDPFGHGFCILSFHGRGYDEGL
jgi:predicted enzyme related to lactoylglutathione lyase